jgi:hypothetical protein
MKLFLKFGSAVVVCVTLAFYFNGCVKIDNPAAPPVDIRSTVKFINLANNGSQMNVKVDGNSVASVSFTNASSYIDVPSGGRNFVFTYGPKVDAVSQVVAAYYKVSYFAIQQAGDTGVTYALYYERNTYSGVVTFIPQDILVRFINLSSDTAGTIKSGVSFHLTGAQQDTSTQDTVTAALAYLKSSTYYQAPLSKAPKYSIIGANNDILVGATAVSLTEGRFTVVLYGSKTANTLQSIIFKED